MSRSVPEWIGKTDDTPPSQGCKRRILERQENCCAMTGKPFNAKEKPFFDHKVPLWLGGENRETNLHAIIDDVHKEKTKAEAKLRAKTNAQQAANLGLKSAPKSPLQGRQFDKKPKRDQLPLPPASQNPLLRRIAHV